MPPFLKIAHRGYSAKYPENTMLAFAKAIEAGADMIELDLQLSRDNQTVVIHDERINRTSDGRGKVSDLTLADLRRYNYNNGMERYGFIQIPTLEDVIDLAANKVLLNIEIKKFRKKQVGIENNLAALLRKKDFTDRVIVSSFDQEILRAMKQIAPAVRTGLIYRAPMKRFRENIRNLGVFSVHPAIVSVDADELRWVQSQELKVYPWVVRDRKTLMQYRATGFVDGAMVDDLTLFDALDHPEPERA